MWYKQSQAFGSDHLTFSCRVFGLGSVEDVRCADGKRRGAADLMC